MQCHGQDATAESREPQGNGRYRANGDSVGVDDRDTVESVELPQTVFDLKFHHRVSGALPAEGDRVIPQSLLDFLR